MSNIVPFTPRPNCNPNAWEDMPVVAQTASNDWERGFQTGLRMASKGVATAEDQFKGWMNQTGVANPSTPQEYEILRLLRQIEDLLKPPIEH